MSRSPLSPWEMLPMLIMLALGRQNLEPWMRRLIDMINGTQNTVQEMQRGINTFHDAVYQMMMPTESNIPREEPGAELSNHPPVNDQTPVDQPHYQPDQEPDLKPALEKSIEQPLEQLTGGQSAVPGDTVGTASPGVGEINTTTEIKPPPSVLPAEMPTKSGH